MKKNYIFLLLLTMLLLLKAETINAKVNVEDSLALVDLYNSTDGPHWRNHDNWLTSNPVRMWHGVQVSGGRVSSLILLSNNLRGFIPSSIGNLTNITYLKLPYNELSGNIPHEIGNLTQLSRLNLRLNQLTGSIPSEIGNLTQLVWFDLSSNQLSGSIPTTIGNLANVSELLLYDNHLGGKIPGEIGKLSKLTHLQLNNNNLIGKIPKTLGNLSALKTLNLQSNQLSDSIPGELGTMSSLEQLRLNSNKLSGNIPENLGGLGGLKYLILNSNKLTGNIPSSFSNLTNLLKLNVSANRLTGTVPAFLANMPRFLYLNMVYDHYTFDGIETLAQHNFTVFNYKNEKHIDIHQNGNTLSVYAGGTLSNNTYNWYNDGNLVATIASDSTYTPTASGNYSVAITNSIATELTLLSDTIAVNGLSQNNGVTAIKLNKDEFSIYPNPARSIVNISFVESGKCIIKVTNISGVVLETRIIDADKKANNIQLNINKYAKGIYFVTLCNEGKQTKTLQLNKQ